MLTDIKSENDCNTITDNENKYNNQIKKRKMNEKTPEKNIIMVSLPSSSPPRSPNSVQSFNNIVIKTPNISRILSHLSIRTPKKNIKNNVSSSLNLLNSLHNTKGERDPLYSGNVFIQTPQSSQPSSPSGTSKKDQKMNQMSRELVQNKFNNLKPFNNVTTPKSMRSMSMNSTPTKSLKSLNFDLSLTPSKESESSFNIYPASPTSSFMNITPTKPKKRTHKIEKDDKNDKIGGEGIDWFKSFSNDLIKEDSNEEDIFKYKRMNSIPTVLNAKSNEYNYRDFERASISSITDDCLSYTSASTSTSSSYDFFKHHANHYHSKNNKKNSVPSSKFNQNQTNTTTRLPLSPELSFLRSNSLYSSSLDKEDSLYKFKKNLLNFSSDNLNIINNNTLSNKEIPISESLSSSSSSLLQNNHLSSSFINSTVINYMVNSKDNSKMEVVSEIESIAETLPISDISMIIDEEDNQNFISLKTRKDNHHSNETDNHSMMNEKVVGSTIYKGFLNIDGIWEDPSLSQCEARSLKDNTLESDHELDEKMDNLNRSKSLPSTPKMRYNETINSAPNTPLYNKDSKKSLRKSNQPLLLNLDGTSSPVSLERTTSLPTLNSPLRKSFSKEKQFTAVNKLNQQIQPSKLYRRTNSLNFYSSNSSASSASASSSYSLSITNKNNNAFIYEKIPSWNVRKRKSLIRSNSTSDLSESLSSERKRSFSSLTDEEDEKEYTSDASSIRRSPSSQRKLNSRRKGKEKMKKTSHQHKYKTIEEKKKGNKNAITSSSISSNSSSSFSRIDYQQVKRDKNKIIEEGNFKLEEKDEMMTIKDSQFIIDDQDLMSISSEIAEFNPDKIIIDEKQEKRKVVEIEKEENSNENEASLLTDPSLTNLEFNTIQQKKKHENKENVHILCNRTEGVEGKTTSLEALSPPPIVQREMIFVDEKGNVYNEQNYKYLSNYTKAVIAAELSKRYCRIPLTEILVSNMPEYRQYFDENGHLKPNNYIYVEEEEEEKEKEKESENERGRERDEGEEKEKEKSKEKSKRKGKGKNSCIKSNEAALDIDDDLMINSIKKNESYQRSFFSSNINLIKNDTKTTIQFRTEPITEEKEMIFESTMSPKGKQEWQDITETSLYDFNGKFDDWDTEEQTMTNNESLKDKKDDPKEMLTPKNKGKDKSSSEDDEEDEKNIDFVEKIDDKITIIYRTNESKYQLVIPIKLNIYNKKDTIL
ncbi:hypothetical protein H8356DRAFT_1010820 [Neocallimastix lanati (nom. inval.)]|nr:hypothetical protein H8356DRAFT_1010820 [Neocallimastix sp. JGI-2020a]